MPPSVPEDTSSFGEEVGRFPHGTHVEGSVPRGVLANPSDPYGAWSTDAATGAAPKARLSLVDFGGYNNQGNYTFGTMVSPESSYLTVRAVPVL